MCQPSEVGSGPASIKMLEGTKGKPGEPGPPGAPGPPGLGADGKQVRLLYKEKIVITKLNTYYNLSESTRLAVLKLRTCFVLDS